MNIMPENNDWFDSEQFEEDLLDAYFHFRNNLPMKDADTGLDYKKSFKTTQDIATELDDMGGVSIEAINRYMLERGYLVVMLEHDYQVATQPDGTVAWAIWERVVRPDSLV